MNWLGKHLARQGRAYFYKAGSTLLNRTSGLVNKAVGGPERGIDWMEDKVGGAADWVAKRTANIPVLGTMTQLGASYVKFQSQVVGGFFKGGLDFVGGGPTWRSIRSTPPRDCSNWPSTSPACLAFPIPKARAQPIRRRGRQQELQRGTQQHLQPYQEHGEMMLSSSTSSAKHSLSHIKAVQREQS